MEGDDGYSEDDRDNRCYRWEPWALMNEEEDNNSAVCVSGRPVAVSCSYIGRLAIAFKKPRQGQVGYSISSCFVFGELHQKPIQFNCHNHILGWSVAIKM